MVRRAASGLASAPLACGRKGRATVGSLRCQQGMTITELIVALGASSALVLLASALLVVGNNGFASQAESVLLDDGGRFAIEAIARSVRQVSSFNWDADGSAADIWSSADASVAGLDARTLSLASAGIDDPRPGAIHGSDVLALRFAGAGPAPAGDGSVLNCAGVGVPASANEAQRAWSIFYVGQGGDGEWELRCKYRSAKGWQAAAIVRGVDSFQVLYGVDTDDNPDGIANVYLTATALNQLDEGLELLGNTAQERQRDFNRKTHWKRVTSIRIGILLHGQKATRYAEPPVNYDLFGLTYSAMHGMRDEGTRISESLMPPDLKGRSRQLYTATIMLRNPSL